MTPSSPSLPEPSQAAPYDAPSPGGRPVVVVRRPGRVGRASLRLIAVWEAFKGVLLLLAAGLAYKLLWPDAEAAAEHLVARLHLNPAGHTSRLFLRAADRLNDTHLVVLASLVGAYTLLRFVEAYGLWFQRRWGWVLGIASAALYLPFEVEHLARRFSWTSLCVFVLNAVIIAVLWHNRTHHRSTDRR